ncbi:Rad21 / Rec8 like protein [Trichinella spiralis]|uniref:Rad21 / Rec8 like protein n=1 Tax=Trichinella spiralis TaxID=6334 RepID=UPI0001EFCF34|nr:Rad21 / Rec8 like protein [Trichinella spiralis]
MDRVIMTAINALTLKFSHGKVADGFILHEHRTQCIKKIWEIICGHENASFNMKIETKITKCELIIENTVIYIIEIAKLMIIRVLFDKRWRFYTMKTQDKSKFLHS